MILPPRPIILLAALMVAALGLSGCAGVVAGAGAQGLVAAAQERKLLDAVDDKTIQLRINARFLNHDANLFRRVETEIVEGRVLLTGNVPRPEDRVEAARLTWQVAGVREVLNEIAVNDRSGILNYFKDSWITTRLRAKMITDAEIVDINYSVETVNGIVYLIGIAQDEAELKRLTGHARTLTGVRRVISHVRMKDDPRRPAS
ncbi:MAG: BON domain-containing protein [Alphaproteobacteria bacterium]|nr:BON domain-containing protein [Alphaproteobacteria bacterium]